jgi:hypothetical protein
MPNGYPPGFVGRTPGSASHALVRLPKNVARMNDSRTFSTFLILQIVNSHHVIPMQFRQTPYIIRDVQLR